MPPFQNNTKVKREFFGIFVREAGMHESILILWNCLQMNRGLVGQDINMMRMHQYKKRKTRKTKTISKH